MFQKIVIPPNVISEVMSSEQGFGGFLFLVTDNTTLLLVHDSQCISKISSLHEYILIITVCQSLALCLSVTIPEALVKLSKQRPSEFWLCRIGIQCSILCLHCTFLLLYVILLKSQKSSSFSNLMYTLL